jgi:hypothetical protein
MAEGKWITKLKNIGSVEGGGLKNTIPKAMLLPIIAFFTSMADAIGSLFGVPIATFDGFAEGVQVLISGFLEAPGQILIAGGQESARSLTQGVWAQFGPLTYIIAVGVVGGAAYLAAQAREEEATGNFVPGIPFDVPYLGTEEEE